LVCGAPGAGRGAAADVVTELCTVCKGEVVATGGGIVATETLLFGFPDPDAEISFAYAAAACPVQFRWIEGICCPNPDGTDGAAASDAASVAASRVDGSGAGKTPSSVTCESLELCDDCGISASAAGGVAPPAVDETYCWGIEIREVSAVGVVGVPVLRLGASWVPPVSSGV
jgi:hypothetical protein